MQEFEFLLITAADSSAPPAQRLAAFGRIVQLFQDLAYGCAYALLGDFHLAEDASQEAFLVAYRELPKLRDPKAFPPWLRRIVVSQCHRLTRRKSLSTTALHAASALASAGPEPSQVMEKSEMKDKVLGAIAALSENQRLATTLFYINGYSQNDIAEFLEVPVTTIKKRLADSRTKLKRRMIDMVKDTLHNNAPDDRFSKKVIEELLAHPRPLEIKGHPVNEVWEKVRSALEDYEVLMGEETVRRQLFKDKAKQQYWDERLDRMAFQLDNDRILRTHTTITALSAICGREPPVRILTPGRVFSDEGIPSGIGNAHGIKVFHLLDGICIDRTVDLELVMATCEEMIQAVFGIIDIRWHEKHYSEMFVERGMVAEIKLENNWHCLSGCAMLTSDILGESGFNLDDVKGAHFGLGLDLAAMLKYGIDDIRKLWQPPYVPK